MLGRMAGSGGRVPRVVVTVADPTRQSKPDVATAKNRLYVDAAARHGAEVVVLDASTPAADRAAAFAAMDGLLLSGGADVAPSRYLSLIHI